MTRADLFRRLARWWYFIYRPDIPELQRQIRERYVWHG